MTDNDLLNVLTKGRSDLLQKVAKDLSSKTKEAGARENVRRGLSWMDKHPHSSAAILSGGVSAAMAAKNSPPGQRTGAAVKSGVTGAATGAALSHGMQALRKHAGVKDSLEALITMAGHTIKNNKPEIAGALIGGAAMGLMQYKASKKNPETGSSPEQVTARKALEASSKSRAATKAKGEEPGMASDLAHGSAQFYQNVTDAFAKHPGKAGLMAVPSGMAAGAGIANRLMR